MGHSRSLVGLAEHLLHDLARRFRKFCSRQWLNVGLRWDCVYARNIAQSVLAQEHRPASMVPLGSPSASRSRAEIPPTPIASDRRCASAQRRVPPDRVSLNDPAQRNALGLAKKRPVARRLAIH